MPHDAPPAIGADDVAGIDGLLASGGRQPRDDTVQILCKTKQLLAELDRFPQLGQPLTQHALGQELRYQQRDMVGLAGGWCDRLRHPKLPV